MQAKIHPMDHTVQNNPLFTSIRQLIEESKQHVAVAVNAAMSMLYWKIGKQINKDILQNTRAGYGAMVINH